MARIYVSSTFSDLEEQRKAVSLALRRLGHEDVAMEYYVAEDMRPLERCLSDVASCDVYVGIFAWRYGYVPIEGNPQSCSITELEYREALRTKKACLIFLLSETAPWPPAKMEFAALPKITALRQELQGSERHVLSTFETADELARKVNEAVIHWEKMSGLPGKRQLTDWDAYRAAVVNRRQWVRMQVIAGATKERGITRIPLTEVFEPQLVALGLSETDVPEEVIKYQEEIYGPRGPAQEEAESLGAEQPEPDGETAESDAEDILLSANPELVLDVLGREPAQVILGGPGTGKSTILHYAMLRLCQAGAAGDFLPMHLQSAPLPFLIELRDFVLQEVPDFISYIVQNSRAFYDANVEAESVISKLEQKRQAVVFFDGLDEVFDPDERRRVINQFQAFAHRYPQAQIVVTSRIAGYDRTALGLAGFEHYQILPLTLGQIRHFAGQWYQYYALEGTERTAQGLVQRIIDNPRLLDLAGNPLLLTMMAVIYKDRDLPNERWRLYQRCAETLLEDWELGKGIEIEDFKLAVLIRTAQKSEILQRVSMYMLEQAELEQTEKVKADRQLNAIAYPPLLDLIASYLEEKYQRSRGDAEAIAVDILRHLMEHTYVLAGIGERVFGFVHRTFMEYFAACRCLAQFNAKKSDFAWLTSAIFGAHWQGGDWEEVLLLLIAMLHDQGTPIREVVEYLRSECPSAIPFNIAFAARCLGEAGDVQDPVHGAALLGELAQTIGEYAPQSRKEEARGFVETALKAFAALAPLVPAPEAVDQNITRLNQGGAVATRMAAWQMGFALRSRKERLDFALAALQDTEEAVRRGAIAALEREWPGRADIGPVLAGVVQNDRQMRVRQAALAAMQRAWRYEPAILDAIASRADDETAYTYVIRLIEYLGVTWRGNPKALDLIVKLAGPKPKARYDYDHTRVAEAAGRAIAQGWRGDSQTWAYLQERAASATEAQTREAVLQAIAQGWQGDPQALTFLRDWVSREMDPQIRGGVIRAIAQGWRGDAQAWSFLHDRAANDPEPQTRAALLHAIAEGWRGDDQAWAFLQERAISDPEPPTRVAALQGIALWWNGDPRAWIFIRQRATDESEPQTRGDAALAIASGWRGDPQALAFLQERATSESDPLILANVLRAMAEGWHDDPQALAFLLQRAANEPDPLILRDVLGAMIQGWGYLPQAWVFLHELVNSSPEPEKRTAVLEILAWGLYQLSYDWPFRDQNFDSLKLAVTCLREHALHDPEVAIRAMILNNFSTLMHRMFFWLEDDRFELLDMLQDLAHNDADVSIRVRALAAIAQTWVDPMDGGFLGDTHQMLTLLSEYLTFLQEQANANSDAATRSAALWTLMRAWEDSAPALAFFQERAADDPAPEARLAALRAIGSRWGDDPQALAFLRNRAVQDPEEGNRLAIADMLERLKDNVRNYYWY